MVVCRVESEGFLDTARCLQILGECGHLPTGRDFGIVHLIDVPDDLNEEELETFLREHGAETREFQGGQKYRRPAAAGLTAAP